MVRARSCYLPHDNRLIQQLCSRRYFLNKKGKIVLEEKDVYEKRGFDSPDRAEGVAYCFYDHGAGGSTVSTPTNLAYMVGSQAYGLPTM